MEKIIGLKEFRSQVSSLAEKIRKGESFLVVKRSKPIFKVSRPFDDMEDWEEVVDFTKIKKGGVKIQDILSRL